jgi:hypothetical protein
MHFKLHCFDIEYRFAICYPLLPRYSSAEYTIFQTICFGHPQNHDQCVSHIHYN